MVAAACKSGDGTVRGDPPNSIIEAVRDVDVSYRVDREP
jgi:hypothetical protein